MPPIRVTSWCPGTKVGRDRRPRHQGLDTKHRGYLHALGIARAGGAARSGSGQSPTLIGSHAVLARERVDGAYQDFRPGRLVSTTACTSFTAALPAAACPRWWVGLPGFGEAVRFRDREVGGGRMNGIALGANQYALEAGGALPASRVTNLPGQYS